MDEDYKLYYKDNNLNYLDFYYKIQYLFYKNIHQNISLNIIHNPFRINEYLVMKMMNFYSIHQLVHLLEILVETKDISCYTKILIINF